MTDPATIAPSGEQVTITYGDQRVVAVSLGGGLRTYHAGGRAVLDGYAEDEVCSGGRGQVLMPWPNRVRDGRYHWGDRDRQLSLTEPEAHNAIHGLVRWAPWRVGHVTDDSAELTFRLYPQQGWSWILDLSVRYSLGPDGLTVAFRAVNRSATACPFGAGFHPYLQAFGGLADTTELRVPAATYYTSDDRGLPTGRQPVDGSAVDFRVARPIGDQVIDTAFTDLDRDSQGRVEIQLTALDASGRALPSASSVWLGPSFTHAMVFTGDTLAPERRRRGVAIEPMTAPPDMLRSGDGLRVLETGEALEGEWGIRAVTDR